MERESIEWRLEGYKGWAIEYPIITEPDGTKYTPIGQYDSDDNWRVQDVSALLP